MTTVSIPLSRGHSAIVDEADAERVREYAWSAYPSLRTVYAQRSFQKPDGSSGTQRLHTFLTGYAITDHRNGDGLDNRRSNLREVTREQNMSNRPRQRNGRSGFKGVTWWGRRGGTWKAQIGCAGRNHHIGYFATAEEAARAYDDAARDLHGEFGSFNFPLPGERAA